MSATMTDYWRVLLNALRRPRYTDTIALLYTCANVRVACRPLRHRSTDDVTGDVIHSSTDDVGVATGNVVETDTFSN